MEEVILDVRVEAGKAVFDDDLMLDAGVQADELVLELDDLHGKEDEYQTVDLDAQPVTADVEVAVDGLEAQPNTNDEQAEAAGDAEEDAQDVSMAYGDEIGYEEEEGVAEEATTEHEPTETTASKAPSANDENPDQRKSEQEAQDVQIDLAEPKMGDDAEEQPAACVDQEATEHAAEIKVGLDVNGIAAADAPDIAVSEAEQADEAVNEGHQLEESQSDHDEAIVDDAAFSITDITVQYDGGSYALFGNSDMDPETYFLSDTEIATAPLSELLASIRSVIASDLTPGEELVIVIDSLDLNFGERSSKDFLQRSFHQIIYCYNVLLAKGIVTETSLTLNLVVRPDPEGRFLELLEEAGIWSGADYSPDYSDASGEDEHLDDDQDIEDYDDNEDLENGDDHEDVQDYEFDDQEHQDGEAQQDQDQEEKEDEQPEGLELTENVEIAEDVEVTEDREVSGNVAENGDVTVSAGDVQDEASEEQTEPQVTADVPENERDTEQFSLEENIVQAPQAEPSADINGERHIDAGESSHGPSGIVDVEHEMDGDIGELQPSLEETTGSDLEHASEMKSAMDEPQPENGDHTEAIDEEEEEEAYDEEEYLEHHEEAEVEEQEDHEADHAVGAEELGDDLTLRQTLDDGNFSLDIMEGSTEGNAVLGLDDNETENNDTSTSRNPDSAAMQDQYTDDGHNMGDYTEVENAVEVEYTHETSHLTINTTDSKDQTEEGAHDFTAEEPATHTSTTNTMSGDEIDYDEHEEQDGSFETEDQVQESSNAQGDDDEIGWGDDGDEDSNDSTQQTTTSQDQPPLTAKRGRTDDLDEEAEEADVKRRRT